MERYAVIHTKFPREFILLQGTGCRYFEYMVEILLENTDLGVG